MYVCIICMLSSIREIAHLMKIFACNFDISSNECRFRYIHCWTKASLIRLLAAFLLYFHIPSGTILALQSTLH